MKFYLIADSLTECSQEDIQKGDHQYVAVVTTEEYRSISDIFKMGVDIDMDLKRIRDTKAVVNYDSLMGTFNIPDHETFSCRKFQLAFLLDERGIVFVDDDDYTERLLLDIQHSRKWKLPSLERFVYDFLEETIKNDLRMLDALEEELNIMETQIMAGSIEEYPENWEKNTVINLTHLLKPESLNIIIDCGTEDFFFEVNCNLHKKLLDEGIPHEFYTRPGSHNWTYWLNSIKYQVLFFSDRLKR